MKHSKMFYTIGKDLYVLKAQAESSHVKFAVGVGREEITEYRNQPDHLLNGRKTPTVLHLQGNPLMYVDFCAVG